MQLPHSVEIATFAEQLVKKSRQKSKILRACNAEKNEVFLSLGVLCASAARSFLFQL